MHVGFEDGAPVALGDVLDRPADLSAHAAGGIDQDVEPARGLHHFGDEIMSSYAIAEIGAVACKVVGSPLDGRDIGEVDLRAAVTQALRGGAADALRGAGYECDLAVEADVHVSIRL
jgi:hypothetical protein